MCRSLFRILRSLPKEPWWFKKPDLFLIIFLKGQYKAGGFEGSSSQDQCFLSPLYHMTFLHNICTPITPPLSLRMRNVRGAESAVVSVVLVAVVFVSGEDWRWLPNILPERTTQSSSGFSTYLRRIGIHALTQGVHLLRVGDELPARVLLVLAVLEDCLGSVSCIKRGHLYGQSWGL